jgi:hypothetical protein
MKIGQQGNPNPLKRLEWKKGQSGNPSGRPKRSWTVKSLIEAALDEKDDVTGETNRKVLINKLVSMAKRGDIIAIKEINNRLDGTPIASVDVTSDGQPIEVNIDAIIGLSRSPAQAAIGGPSNVLKGV